MKFDSEEQKKNLLALIAKVPVQTDLGSVFQGPPPEIRELVEQIQEAEIEAPEEGETED